MHSVALTLAVIVAVANLASGVWGAWGWYRVQASRAFWPLVRIGQGAAIVQAVGAGVLAAAGYDPPDGLYWLYALLPVAVSFIAEQFRIASAETVLQSRGLESAQAVGRLGADGQQSVALAIVRREMGVMAVAALVICFLALRAITTG